MATSMSAIVKAVAAFKAQVESEGAQCDLTNVDYTALQEAIDDEKKCGARGTVMEFIEDFNDSVGLTDFGFEFPDEDDE